MPFEYYCFLWTSSLSSVDFSFLFDDEFLDMFSMYLSMFVSNFFVDNDEKSVHFRSMETFDNICLEQIEMFDTIDSDELIDQVDTAIHSTLKSDDPISPNSFDE